MRLRRLVLVSAVLVLGVSRAHAWGERGHDAVTRVAVRIVVARAPQAMSVPFLRQEHLLAHLANVPDTVWKLSRDPRTTRHNGPTHYIGLDHLADAPSWTSLPRDYAAASKQAAHRGHELLSVGTAPWRVAQFYELLTQAFTRVPRQGDVAPVVDEALVFAGLLSHFVADLSVPVHVVKDYDGYERHQGGLHAFFEAEVVAELPLDLEATALAYALAQRPAERLRKGQKKPSALDWAFALALDSYQRRDVLVALDREVALLAPSRTSPKTPAKRRPSREVAARYRPLIEAQLATAADVLASLWVDAWKQAGSPDLGRYTSTAYPVAPPFVLPDYAQEARD